MEEEQDNFCMNHLVEVFYSCLRHFHPEIIRIGFFIGSPNLVESIGDLYIVLTLPRLHTPPCPPVPSQ